MKNILTVSVGSLESTREPGLGLGDATRRLYCCFLEYYRTVFSYTRAGFAILALALRLAQALTRHFDF